MKSDIGQIPEFQPKFELDALYSTTPKYPFTATTAEQALEWKRECRAVLSAKLGFLDSGSVDPECEVIEEVDRGDYTRQKMVIATSPYSKMPVYILKPKWVSGKLPVVIANHGHGYGVKDIVGLWENGEERYTVDGYQKDFATELCTRGFLVVAPEIACFGERRTDFSYLRADEGQWVPDTCENTALYAFMLGKSALGMKVRDAMGLVDYISTLPHADVSRLGVMGISGGGMLTFFHTALDDRVKACIVSGYYSSFKESILAMRHCPCNYVPGMLEIGEMCDLVGLILPRPMLVEAGTRDMIFPIETVRSSVNRAREICSIMGGDPNWCLQLDEFEGRHQISGRMAYDFLKTRLEK